MFNKFFPRKLCRLRNNMEEYGKTRQSKITIKQAHALCKPDN
jgi:hypothetical protein